MMTVVTTDLSIEHLFNLIEKYERSTNAKINIEKTEALWVGKWATRIDKPNNLKWVANYVKFVGVHIGNNREVTCKVSFSEIMDSIKNKLSKHVVYQISYKLAGENRLIKELSKHRYRFPHHFHPLAYASSKDTCMLYIKV